MMPLYAFARGLFGGVIGVSNGFRVEGLENLPRKGPALVVCNHASLWDPIVLGTVLPRQVFFMAKKEIFRNPLFSTVLRWVGAFKVNRGGADREAIQEAIKNLRAGRMVGIFIEGTRNRTSSDFLPPQPGAAMLALRSGAPVVPVALVNTKNTLRAFRSKIIIRVGKPLEELGSADGPRREQYAEAGALIIESIARLYAN